MTAKAKPPELPPPGAPIPNHSRMDGARQQRRSDAFRRFTQRKGMPTTYGTGQAGVLADKALRPEEPS